MISDEYLSLSEREKLLRSKILDVDTFVSKLQSLHKFFKFTSSELLEVISSDKNAVENLDTLISLFIGESEMCLEILETHLKESRELMFNKQNSQKQS